jgi:lipid II:glycine glycyltransferase (peptidoglycan interpeptide bridge formation enzyme)
MQLIELSSFDKENYNQFVAASPSGSFLQSWEWGEWQSALGRQIFRYKILDISGTQVAAIQLIKMALPFGKYYLYAPYGPVGNAEFRIQNSEWLQELQKKFKGVVFIRIEPKDMALPTAHYPLLTKSKNIQPGKTLLIDLNKTQEQLLGEMHHKTRYNIKVAQKHGVEIKDEFDITIGHGLFAKEALNLIAETAHRQGFKDFGVSYYNKMVDFIALKNRGELKLHIYKAVYLNKILASAIMLDFGKTRTFLFGGSSDEHKNVMAPYLLHWQAILDAKAKGFGIYDFWGTETASGAVPGFVRFKLGFGGHEETYGGAYDFVIKKTLYRGYGALRSANKIIKKISPR